MILSDNDILKETIKKNISITPFNANNVSPASYDVTLGDEFITYIDEVIELDKQINYKKIKCKRIMIVPKVWTYKLTEEDLQEYYIKYEVDIITSAILGTTKEWIKLPANISAQFQGRSSIGRLFVQSHQTAGWIDPGFEGNITLEITAFDRPVILTEGMKIGQLIFHYCNTPSAIPYNKREKSKYNKQKSVVPSLIYKE